MLVLLQQFVWLQSRRALLVSKTAGSHDIIQGYASFQRIADSWKCSLRNITASVMHTDINLQSVYRIKK